MDRNAGNAFYFPDNVPLYGRDTYERLQEENVPASVTTVINMRPSIPPPRDHLIWSIFSFLYMNFCCLGCMALTFSVKARDRKVIGDMEGARHYASTAKCLNITTLTLTLLTVIIFVILVFVGVIFFPHL
ncbi:dispanin subfamily A member 2b-like [Protopterus annectens]|uniref:dispanin subfamily A member 2b-like n=1 Tax=Protopterus annectens TaxID=7888 RepID=UPI001CFB141F|nr:dispanin subfamily A member 2b-like [Protopterus annectens]